MSTSSKATAPTAREVAASIKALGGGLTALVDMLAAAVPAASARALAELDAAIRAAVEPTPPSATAAEKRDPRQPDDGWPRDMAAGDVSEPAWGRDPEGLRHG